MSSRLLSPLLIACGLLALLAFASSCKRDKCKKVTCEHGECVDGTCVCPSGYEGSACADAVNAKFAGIFSSTEGCTAGSDAYDLTFIPEDGSLKGVRVVGIWDKPDDTIAMVVKDDGFQFAIGRQPCAGYEIEGEGSMAVSLLSGNINYRVYQTGAVNPFDDCTLTFSNE